MVRMDHVQAETRGQLVAALRQPRQHAYSSRQGAEALEKLLMDMLAPVVAVAYMDSAQVCSNVRIAVEQELQELLHMLAVLQTVTKPLVSQIAHSGKPVAAESYALVQLPSNIHACAQFVRRSEED